MKKLRGSMKEFKRTRKKIIVCLMAVILMGLSAVSTAGYVLVLDSNNEAALIIVADGVREYRELNDFILIEESVFGADVGFSFDNLQQGKSARTAGTWFIRNGQSLRLNALSWTPTGQSVLFGIQNVQTGRLFYTHMMPGGFAFDMSIAFPSAPTGEYRVVVVNELGPAAISGSLNFRWL